MIQPWKQLSIRWFCSTSPLESTSCWQVHDQRALRSSRGLCPNLLSVLRLSLVFNVRQPLCASRHCHPSPPPCARSMVLLIFDDENCNKVSLMAGMLISHDLPCDVTSAGVSSCIFLLGLLSSSWARRRRVQSLLKLLRVWHLWMIMFLELAPSPVVQGQGLH